MGEEPGDDPLVSAMASRFYESGGGTFDTIIYLLGQMFFDIHHDDPEGGEYEVIAEIPAAPKGPVGTFRRGGLVTAATMPGGWKQEARLGVIETNRTRPDWSEEMEADVRKGEPTMLMVVNRHMGGEAPTVKMQFGVDTEHFGWIDSGVSRTMELPDYVDEITSERSMEFLKQVGGKTGMRFRVYVESVDPNHRLKPAEDDNLAPKERGRTPQARVESRQARQNIPTVLELVDGGMSHAEAIAEWKKRYRREKARLKRDRDKQTALFDDAAFRARNRDALADPIPADEDTNEVLAAYDALIRQDIAVGMAAEGDKSPLAIYGLSAEAATDLIKAGFMPGPGAVPDVRIGDWSWAKNAQAIPEGEIVPVIDLTIQGIKVGRGLATRRGRMTYLIEIDQLAQRDEQSHRGQVPHDWKSSGLTAASMMNADAAGITIGIAETNTILVTGNQKSIAATGGDRTITYWSSEPHVGTMLHEAGHNIDTGPILAAEQSPLSDPTRSSDPSWVDRWRTPAWAQGVRFSKTPMWHEARVADKDAVSDIFKNVIFNETASSPVGPRDADQPDGREPGHVTHRVRRHRSRGGLRGVAAAVSQDRAEGRLGYAYWRAWRAHDRHAVRGPVPEPCTLPGRNVRLQPPTELSALQRTCGSTRKGEVRGPGPDVDRRTVGRGTETARHRPHEHDPRADAGQLVELSVITEEQAA